MADFSSIPSEVLGLIFEHISKNPFVDDLSFTELSKEFKSIVGVSKEWKSTAMEKLKHLLPHAILLSHQHKEKPLSLDLRGKWSLATNNGCLLITDGACNLFLLNPLSKAQIPLPLPLPIPPCNLRNTSTDLIFTVKFNSNTDYHVAICKNMWDETTSYFSRIFACNAGDEKWTVLKVKWPYAQDVAYYNQKIYVIYNGEHLHVISQLNTTCKDKVYYNNSNNGYGDGPYRYQEGKSYLVETPQNELLIIFRYVKKKKRGRIGKIIKKQGGNGKTIDFEVFKINDKCIDENWYNKKQETGDKVWDQVEDLGDKVMFLGKNSLCLLVQDVPGCMANSIYFTDYIVDKEDRGVFSMEDKEIKPLFQECPFMSVPFLWFTPNLLS